MIPSIDGTIHKTLLTSVLQDGFWSRWFAHGIEPSILNSNRIALASLDGWISILSESALSHSLRAEEYKKKGNKSEAEQYYRLSGLYYCLIQWVYPAPDINKNAWHALVQNQFDKADALSDDLITVHKITINGRKHIGRVRVPVNSAGTVIIVNPIDSPKEELFSYEKDFAEAGFTVISFDGPGQGGSVFDKDNKASTESWGLFLNRIIEFSHRKFPSDPLHLFGTSSGAAWAIEGSQHPFISKSVAVSPPCGTQTEMPDYFKERMHHALEDFNSGFLPSPDKLELSKNVLLFHGKQDVMVKGSDIYDLYSRLENPKRLIEYEEAGHCCDEKLQEIRKRSIQWFKGESLDEI